MNKYLFLMLGYPGSGKTTAAETISRATGAIHIWADHERRESFGTPSYTKQENDLLYSRLNQKAENALKAGKSVVYDTAFNRLADRKKLADIAARAGAQTIVVWAKAPKSLAKQRATQSSDNERTRKLGNMHHEHFERLSGALENPTDDESVIELDGTRITDDYIKLKLRQCL